MTTNQPDADLVSQVASLILAVRWPDGSHLDGVTRRVAEMIAADLAPYIAEREAAALEAAADGVQHECSQSDRPCFCTSADWLRDRATNVRSLR